MSLYSPVQQSLIPSAARTAAPASGVMRNNDGARQLSIITNISANPGGLGSITVTVGYLQLNSTKIPLVSSAAQTLVGATVLHVSIDLAAAANAVAKNVVPARIYVDVVHNNANPITYSVDAELLP